MTRERSLETALRHKDILIVCGAGGVGKTTVAASLAVAAAQTRDVMVLTIDPARRLATALGLDGALGHAETMVRTAGSGRLTAAMLDMRTAWDEFVDAYAPSEQVAAHIRANPLFRSLSQHFVGSQSYMAMERLATLANLDEHDLIVVDTPPTRSALEFLDAPKRMTDFVGGSLLRWLAKPYAMAGKFGLRAFSITATPFLRVADRVLGSQLLEDLSAFVVDFQTLYARFRQHAEEVQSLLRDRRTGFVVVTTLEGPPLDEAGYFIDRLADEHLPLAGVVANRVVPQRFACDDAAKLLAALEEPGGGASEPSADAALESARKVLRVLYDGAVRDRDRLADLRRRSGVAVATVPLLATDIGDLDSLLRLSETILGN